MMVNGRGVLAVLTTASLIITARRLGSEGIPRSVQGKGLSFCCYLDVMGKGFEHRRPSSAHWAIIISQLLQHLDS